MRQHLAWSVALLTWLMAVPTLAQTPSWRGTESPATPPARVQPGPVPGGTVPAANQPPAYRPTSANPAQRPVGAVQPDQPVTPNYPTLQRRPAAPPAAPFRLTPEQDEDLGRMLLAWEQHSARVKTFGCDFTRFEYDPVFGDANKPRYVDKGQIKYAAPDKGMFRIDAEERKEHWICDGKSIFEFNYPKKQLIERKLPPEMQGQAIADGPLPFIFGAKADKLKERYFMRLIAPPEPLDAKEHVGLEAYPRFQQDAANFQRAEIILAVRDMTPFALRLYAPNSKSHTVYVFARESMVVNDPLRIIKFDPFRALTPLGWEKIVEEPPAQASQQPAPPQVGVLPQRRTPQAVAR